MNILGISGLHNSMQFKKEQLPELDECHYRIIQGFDAAAAFIKDGNIVTAAAEERFNRQKATGAFPQNAIKFCLDYGKTNLDDIDYIAHAFNYEPYKDDYLGDDYYTQLFDQVYSRKTQERLIQEHLGISVTNNDRFIQIPHHLAHAASCYYPSGYSEALILIADGMGEKESLTIALGQNNEIKIIHKAPALYSLGLFYSVFTMYLGFDFNSDEYKVMGLAPYGNPQRFSKAVMDLIPLGEKGHYRIPMLQMNMDIIEKETFSKTQEFLIETFGAARQADEVITQRHMDIAAAVQFTLQNTLMHVLFYYQALTQTTQLVMAGGVALNCTANSYIKKTRLFNKMFIQAASGDDGTAIGAALYVYRVKTNHVVPAKKINVPSYYGPSSSGNEIFLELQKYTKCCYREFTDHEMLCKFVANKIAKSNIIGWYQGRMEFGPRALGNRSILADPRDPLMKDKLNARIKLRENFRPFAPAVLSEYAKEIFDIELNEIEDYMHMLLVAEVRKKYQNLLPAVTHIDKTARLQTVFKKYSMKFWQLINEFYKLTEIPVLINTSFNIKGQPIVCEVKDALDTLSMANLDLVVIENYVISYDLGKLDE